jgi:hypothetical protein
MSNCRVFPVDARATQPLIAQSLACHGPDRSHVAPANKNSSRSTSMSNTLAFEPRRVPRHRSGGPAVRRGIAAALKAAIESLVAAQGRQFEQTGPFARRFPPF